MKPRHIADPRLPDFVRRMMPALFEPREKATWYPRPAQLQLWPATNAARIAGDAKQEKR